MDTSEQLPWEQFASVRSTQVSWGQYPTHPEGHSVRKFSWEGMLTVRFEPSSYSSDTVDAQIRRDNFVRLMMKNIIQYVWRLRTYDVVWVSATEYGLSGKGHCHVLFNFLPYEKTGGEVPDLTNFDIAAKDSAAWICKDPDLKLMGVDLHWIPKYDNLGLATYVSKKETGHEFKHFDWSVNHSDWIEELVDDLKQ